MEQARADPAAAGPVYLTDAGFEPLHGFTTRHTGASSGPYASLNLGLSSGDERALVEANRDLLLERLGVGRDQVCAFDQVHGKRVLVGSPAWFEDEADAAISDDPGLLLVVSAADCFPLLFFDPASGAVGAAHAGWRGTLAGIAGEVVGALGREYGSTPLDLQVLIGPGIGACCYEVSREVAGEFELAGFSDACFRPGAGERPHLDILNANREVLTAAGVLPGRVTAVERCTSCERELFYSHRRDRGKTGRMWGFVRATGAPRASM